MSLEIWLQYLIYALLIIMIVLGARYFWLSISQRVHHPEQWINAVKERTIPQEIIDAEKKYDDKVRLYNFWFQINRLSVENVTGDFAELGVYKGDSAWLIHKLAPARKLHLFDTFSGFHKPDLSLETGDAATYDWHSFADTDIDTVRAKLGGSPNILYHEGYFPDTTAGLNELSFAFVNIDADLYLPVKAGLEFFYPRLSPGGVIIVHDFTHKWEGLSKAVNDFSAKIPENLIHVPDRFGTVMIIKNKAN